MKQFFQIIFFVLFYSIFYNIICQNEIHEDIFEGENTKDYISYIIEPGKLQTEYLKYEKYNVFKVSNNHSHKRTKKGRRLPSYALGLTTSRTIL